MSDVTLSYNNISIVPAPKISIKSDMIYTNDNIIGYKYTIDLEGTAIDEIQRFSSAISSAEKVRAALSHNGSSLEIKDSNNSTLIKAIGGILISLNFDTNENNGSKYIKYNATIEFNELQIFDENFSCSAGFIQSNNFSSQFLDLNKYKIQEFKDGWNFNLADESLSFNKKPEIYNTQIKIKYEISATGRLYINDDKTVTPGWLQAKNFAQERLFDQITNMANSNILKQSGSSACESSSGITNIHDYGNGTLEGLTSNYDICNETITCSTSESNGTFSATYEATLKFRDSSQFGGSKATHSFTKNVTTEYRGNRYIYNIKINGTIQGLNSSNLGSNIGLGGFSLPKNGKLLMAGNKSDKIDNAIKIRDKILNSDQDDLADNFKNELNITAETLFPNKLDCISDKIYPAIFNLTTNNFLGTIEYNAEYTSDRLSAIEDGNYVLLKTTINVENPTPIIAELPTPKGNYIIQDLKTQTNKKINISINGRDKDRKCCSDSMLDLAKSAMNFFTLPDSQSDFILMSKNISYNLTDQSYTMNVSYICSSGCSL